MSRVGLGGGYGTPAMPGVLSPGTTEPAARTLPTTPTQPVVIGGVPFALPTDPEALDALARMIPPSMLGMPANMFGFTPQSWAELVAQKGDAGRIAAATLLARLQPFGNLPDDVEITDSSGDPWYGWPSGSDHQLRQVFTWYVDQQNAWPFMQVQKYAPPGSGWGGLNGAWRIFNQWGQDLTFVQTAPHGNWTAGWDLGDWLRQNAKTVTDAISAAMQALITVMTLGAGSAVVGATAAAQVAQQGFIRAAKGLATGNLGDIAGGVSQMAGGLSGVNDATHGELARAMRDFPGAQALAQSDFGQWFGGLVSNSPSQGKGGTFGLIDDIKKIGAQLGPVTTEFIAKTKALFAPAGDFGSAVWFNRGLIAGWQDKVTTERAKVPWYGLVAFDAGAVAGAAAYVQGQQPAQLAGVPSAAGGAKAARIDRSGGALAMSPAVALDGTSQGGWSTTKKLVVGSGVAVAATAAAVYTQTGRALVRRFAAQPKTMIALEGAAVLGVLAALYALTRPKPTPQQQLIQTLTSGGDVAMAPAAAKPAIAQTAAQAVALKRI